MGNKAGGKYNPCGSPGKNFDKFKTGSSNGRPIIAIWWDGDFPEGGSERIMDYKAAYWYQGRGYKDQYPLSMFEDFGTCTGGG